MKIILLIVVALFGCSLAIPWESAPQDNQGWYDKHNSLLQQTANHRNDNRITFVGDSITEGWLQNGKNVWNQYYAPNGGYDYGIGGDRTENILWRIDNNEFDGLQSKATALMIGTNNLAGDTIEDIARGVQEILTRLKNKMPNSKIILLGVLPRAEPLGSKAKDLNALIAKFGDNKTVYWWDMWSEYANADGTLKPGLYTDDNLHLIEGGYQNWQRVMDPILQQLLQ